MYTALTELAPALIPQEGQKQAERRPLSKELLLSSAQTYRSEYDILVFVLAKHIWYFGVVLLVTTSLRFLSLRF